jgi:hypothetical protein
MQNSGVEAAIRELEREVSQIQDVIGKLKRIRATRRLPGNSNGALKKRNLSPEARRRIALAAKKRWAAYRSAKAK